MPPNQNDLKLVSGLVRRNFSDITKMIVNIISFGAISFVVVWKLSTVFNETTNEIKLLRQDLSDLKSNYDALLSIANANKDRILVLETVLGLKERTNDSPK